MEIAFKIDVDTHQGLEEGVPRLQRALTDRGITGTFFIAMGPDNSGRAIMRMFRNPGFLAKMRRTNAASMYGLRTVLSGTLLRARPIALAYPEIIRDLARSGFEIGVHGYDHVHWQDHIGELDERDVRAEVDEAGEIYRAILGAAPRSFAAPGWRTSDTALHVLEDRQLSYRSDTRGRDPYRCRVAGEVLATPEIPTTLPTLDEVMGTAEVAAAGSIVEFYLREMREDALNVHTIHAETEGMGQLDVFTALIDELKKQGAGFVALREIAARLIATELPVCSVVRTTLPGRAGWISAQAPAA
jgi:peptidoglycan/xylan/chitin deacetylase (PgdA/CDA1 family)